MTNRKKDLTALDSKTAGQMLDNIFDSCDMEPNSVPFETIRSYHKYRSERFIFQRALLIFMMIVVLLLPLLVVSPNFKIKNITEDMKPAYEVYVSGHLPIKKVSASINGKSIPISQTDDRVFVAKPPINGNMNVIVTLFNNQSATDSITVDNIDTDNPYILSHESRGNYFYVTVGDKNSGVDFESLYCKDSLGNIIKPDSYDSKTGVIKIKRPTKDQTLNIFVPDYADNMLQVVINTD